MAFAWKGNEMRTKTLLTFLAVLCFAGVLYAAVVPWDIKKAPPINIAEGYRKAVVALATTPNNYHCIGAEIYDGGEWLYHFVSSTGADRWVAVEFDGKVAVRTHREVLH